MKKSVFALMGCALLSLNACAPRLGGSQYAVSGVGDVSQTLPGTIVAKRPVEISAKSPGNENTPGLGALIGAGTAGLVGSQIGKGKGQVAGAVGGALLGGVAGHYAEDALTSQKGFEYQVRLDRGGPNALVTITQGAEPNLSVGQHVFVIQAGKGRSRVVPA